MNEVTVTPAALFNASSGVLDSADRLDSRVRGLSARVAGLLNGGWSGQAADAFRREWEQWQHGATEVVGGLDTTARLLASAGQAYASTDAGNSTTIGSTTSSLSL